jgi:hypothetical protein
LSLQSLGSQFWRERAAGELAAFLREHDVPARIADAVVGLVRYAAEERLAHVRLAVETDGDASDGDRPATGRAFVGLSAERDHGFSLLDLLRLRAAISPD